MPHTMLGTESRHFTEKANQTIELCNEDIGQCKAQLKAFIKENKDRFTQADIALLLDMWDTLDLVTERLTNTNEDLSDVLFGSD